VYLSEGKYRQASELMHQGNLDVREVCSATVSWRKFGQKTLQLLTVECCMLHRPNSNLCTYNVIFLLAYWHLPWNVINKFSFQIWSTWNREYSTIR
jgi:hypothetical protein